MDGGRCETSGVALGVRNRCPHYVFLLALFAALLPTRDAAAAGFFLPGRGVEALGRGGAFVVSGEQSLTSIWYNPANLGGMEELRLTVDLSLVGASFRFQRAPRTLDNGDVVNFDEVRNSAPLKPPPQILVGGPIRAVDGLTWAFGAYTPLAAGHTFPEDGAQRYAIIDNDTAVAVILHLAAGWQLSERVRIGAGFQNMPASLQIVSMSSGYTGLYGDPEDHDLDILTRITLVDWWVPSGNIGVWFALTERLQLGASAQLPFTFKTNSAKMETRLPRHPQFQGAKLNGDTVSGGLKFPPFARVGIRYAGDLLDVELAAVWEGWSVMEAIEVNPNDISVTDIPGIGSIPVGPMTVPLNWRDTWSVRLGADLKLDGPVTPRAGYTFETSAVPDETYSVFLADNVKHMVSAGASIRLSDSVSLDAALAAYLMGARTITNSQWRQVNPTDDQGKVTTIVGNGHYTQRYIAGGLGVRIAF